MPRGIYNREGTKGNGVSSSFKNGKTISIRVPEIIKEQCKVLITLLDEGYIAITANSDDIELEQINQRYHKFLNPNGYNNGEIDKLLPKIKIELDKSVLSLVK